MEFIAGLVLGALLGVVADRLWGGIESLPKLTLKASMFSEGNGHEGLTLTVTNVGPTSVPDYTIFLWHSDRGSLRVFGNHKSGLLLPTQTRKHGCVLQPRNDKDDVLRNWLFHQKDQPVSTVSATGFVFRLVMNNSTKVLFEDARIGNALAEFLVESFSSSPLIAATATRLDAISCHKPMGIFRALWLKDSPVPGVDLPRIG